MNFKAIYYSLFIFLVQLFIYAAPSRSMTFKARDFQNEISTWKFDRDYSAQTLNEKLTLGYSNESHNDRYYPRIILYLNQLNQFINDREGISSYIKVNLQFSPVQQPNISLWQDILDKLQTLKLGVNLNNNYLQPISVPILLQTSFKNIYKDLYDYDLNLIKLEQINNPRSRQNENQYISKFYSKLKLNYSDQISKNNSLLNLIRNDRSNILSEGNYSDITININDSDSSLETFHDRNLSTNYRTLNHDILNYSQPTLERKLSPYQVTNRIPQIYHWQQSKLQKDLDLQLQNRQKELDKQWKQLQKQIDETRKRSIEQQRQQEKKIAEQRNRDLQQVMRNQQQQQRNVTKYLINLTNSH